MNNNDFVVTVTFLTSVMSYYFYQGYYFSFIIMSAFVFCFTLLNKSQLSEENEQIYRFIAHSAYIYIIQDIIRTLVYSILYSVFQYGIFTVITIGFVVYNVIISGVMTVWRNSIYDSLNCSVTGRMFLNAVNKVSIVEYRNYIINFLTYLFATAANTCKSVYIYLHNNKYTIKNENTLKEQIKLSVSSLMARAVNPNNVIGLSQMLNAPQNEILGATNKDEIISAPPSLPEEPVRKKAKKNKNPIESISPPSSFNFTESETSMNKLLENMFKPEMMMEMMKTFPPGPGNEQLTKEQLELFSKLMKN